MTATHTHAVLMSEHWSSENGARMGMGWGVEGECVNDGNEGRREGGIG